MRVPSLNFGALAKGGVEAGRAHHCTEFDGVREKVVDEKTKPYSAVAIAT